jgi:hypothetical protein
MKFFTSTLKHLCILVIGIMLAIVFAWIVYDARDLSASVLSLQERAFMETAHRDAAYKKADGSVEIFISPPLQSSTQLFVSLLFSPSELSIERNRISSPYEWKVISETENSLLVQVSDFSTGNGDEGILIVPFSGNAKDITLEFVTDERDTGQFFAIGALESTGDSHL